MTMTWNQIETLHTNKIAPSDDCQPEVMFIGKDSCDHYAIVKNYGTEGQDNTYTFYLFFDTDLDNPTEIVVYNNAASAAAWLAFRFILDNEDGSDSYNPYVQECHRKAQNALSDLVGP